MHKIAVIAGDGIGKEVMPEGIRVLEAAGKKYNIQFEWNEFPWSCDYYRKEGKMMSKNGLDIMAEHEAVFLGAVGDPAVPDHVSLWGLLIPIRRAFDQYVNLRPVKTFEGIQSPLVGRKAGDIDYYVIRENTEGEYSEIGGRVYAGTPKELAVQESIFTRAGVERVMRYAFTLAKKVGKPHVSSATKSNGIVYTMPFWDQIFEEIGEEFPDVKGDKFHIDAFCAKLVLDPSYYDVIVASNLFGDILSDLGPATTGSLGIAPSANLNPEKEHPSMFEPVHGSAPDIAGKGIANPIGQIWSGALMLDHLGYPEAAKAVEKAMTVVLAEAGPKTPDLKGNAGTEDMGKAIAAAIE